MSNSVDNRIVEMQFKNDQFEQKISQTIASLDKLTAALQLKDVSKGFAGVTASAQQVDISSISAKIKDVNWVLMAFEASFQQVFRNLTNIAMDTGTKILKALTIDGAMAGFNEYELKMGAIQTMMAGTGESLSTVNKYLQELNEYSDKTIYSFADMTQNIGKFTNAGVKLPIAVSAIKGIANVAALSGANAEEASRAMYNFSQALSKGSVALIDWKSIELANMGTVEFKQQLLDAGVAAGTLKKSAGGMYEVLSKNGQGSTMKQTISATKNFNDSLAYQWMTTGVLTKTLGDYASETTNIGKRANKAATEVKTFTQLMQTTQEAIGSQWATTAELVFGDKDEAVRLWTYIADAIGSIIGPMGEARNEMLKFWNDNNGRTAVIKGFVNIFRALGAILAPIGKAFREVFPPTTGKDLVRYSKSFEQFTKKLMPSAKVVETIGQVFKVFFSVIGVGIKAVGFVATTISAFVSSLIESKTVAEGASNSFNVLKSAFDKIGEGIKKIFYLNKEGNKLTSGMAEGLIKAWQKYTDFMGKVKDRISKIVGGIRKVLSPVGSAVKDAFSGISFDNVFKSIMTLLAGGALIQFSKFVKSFTDLAGSFSGVGKALAGIGNTFSEKINNILGGFTGVLKGMQNQLNAEALKKIAVAIAILAASMFLISLIKPERLNGALVAISLLLVEVLGIMTNFSKINGSKGVIVATTALSLIGAALILMSLALARLGKLKPEELTRGLVGVGVILTQLGLFTKFAKTDAGLLGVGAGLILFGVALSIMAKALSVLGEMDGGKLDQSLLTLGLIFGSIAAFTKLVKPSDIVVAGINMVLLAAGITILAGALKILGSMSLDQLAIALLGLTLGLGVLVVALNAMPKDLGLSALSLVVTAAAIAVLAGALKILGSMSLKEIGKSMLALVGALVAIGVFLYAMGTNPLVIVGALSLIVVAEALVILAGAMKVLGSMSGDSIGKALLAMAGAFIVIGIAGYALTGALPGLLGFAAALLLMGTAIFLAGAGIGLFAGGLAALSVVVASSGKVILDFLIQIAAALPILAKSLAKALGAFVLGLVEQQGALITAMISMFTTVLTSLSAVLPQILGFISTLITGIVDLLILKVPEIANAMSILLLQIMTTIQMYLPLIIDMAGNIAVSFINGMANYYVKIAAAGANFIIKVIEGVGKQMVKITNAAMTTVIAFINGLTAAINKNGPKFDTAVKDLIGAIFNRAQSLVTGGTYGFGKIANHIINGLRDGLINGIDRVVGAISGVIGAAYAAAKKAGWIKSPSRLFAKIGVWIVEGLAVGLEATSKVANSAAEAVVNSAYSAMQAATNAASNIFDNIEDPVISPVVNLDNVYKGAKAISSLMGNSSSVRVSGAVASRMGTPISGNTTTSTDGSISKKIEFTQNIYSPKPVNRLEIYRQTRNQLRGLGTL